MDLEELVHQARLAKIRKRYAEKKAGIPSKYGRRDDVPGPDATTEEKKRYRSRMKQRRYRARLKEKGP